MLSFFCVNTGCTNKRVRSQHNTFSASVYVEAVPEVRCLRILGCDDLHECCIHQAVLFAVIVNACVFSSRPTTSYVVLTGGNCTAVFSFEF